MGGRWKVYKMGISWSRENLNNTFCNFWNIDLQYRNITLDSHLTSKKHKDEEEKLQNNTKMTQLERDIAFVQ